MTEHKQITEHKQMTGYVHSLESFGSVDGPGIRYVIFLNGCAMRCQYCHNPDTWNMQSGTLYTPEELIKKAKKYRAYWGDKGGITVSGGEPLLQLGFLLELFKRAKAEGIHTTLDTSGNPFTREEPFIGKFQELLQYTDLIMLDIKHVDESRHETLTGCTNRNILDLAEYLSEKRVPVWIRHVLVPGINDEDEHLEKLHGFIQTLHNIEKVEILPYHAMGIFKWKELGMGYPLEGVEPPSEELIEKAEKILQIK